MSEHIVQLNAEEKEELAKWLERPNGAHCTPRATFEAVVGGGILVRTKPYSYSSTFRDTLNNRAPALAAELTAKFIDMGMQPTEPFHVHDQITDWKFEVKPHGDGDWASFEDFNLTAEAVDIPTNS